VDERTPEHKPEHKPVKLHLITGFLGAGKTTLLRNLLAQGLNRERIVVLVNEFGDVGMDGALLRRGSYEVVELSSGCVCCQIGPDMLRAVIDMIEHYAPDRIVCELSGVADPGRVLDILLRTPEMLERARLEPIVCVVDARSVHHVDSEQEMVWLCQVKSSDVILLNKMDLVADGGDLEAGVAELNPRARVLRSTQCEVDLAALFAFAGAESPAQVEPTAPNGQAHHHAHDEIFESFVIRDPDGIYDRHRVEEWLRALGPEVFRLKGVMRLQTGEFFVNWVRVHFQWEPAAAGDAPPTTLVLIGRGMNEAVLRAGLNSCKSRKPRGIRLTGN
jgi:G3E family GTPase